MASSLSLQLSQIAAKSVNSLNLKAQKAAHSKSLIFEPRVAASQSFDSLYIICHEGFEELCLLDGRFLGFENDLFSPQSQEQERTQMTAAQNEQLDSRTESFLGLVGGRLRLNPAIKAVEWLVRRFKIHEYNTSCLLTTFLPYHTLQVFITLLSILPPTIPQQYKFLHPYIRSLNHPPRHVIVHAATNNAQFTSTFNTYVLRVCKARQHHTALLAFWAGIMSEATSGMLDKSRSGRLSVQLQNEQDAILKLLPMLNEGLALQKVPELQIGCYMLLSIMASKGGLDDKFLTPMMKAIVTGWVSDTITPGLVCLSVLAQYREAKQLPKIIARRLAKVPNLSVLLSQISKDRQIDRLANGLCLSLVSRLGKKADDEALMTISQIIERGILKTTQVKVIMKALLLAAFRLDEKADADDKIRGDLALCLSRLSQTGGVYGVAVRAALAESEVDIDELEMKLRVAIQPPVQHRSADVIMKDNDNAPTEQGPKFSSLMAALPQRTANENSFLSHDASHIYLDLCEAFLAATAKASYLDAFDAAPVLRRDTALSDALYLTFYIRFWCGAHPVLARVAALNMVTRFLSQTKEPYIDIQAALPYVITALGDSAMKVRRAAATLLVPVGEHYPVDSVPRAKAAEVNQWAFEEIYGRGSTTHGIKWLSLDVAVRFLREILLPSLEECVLDGKHIHSVLEKAINGTTATEIPRKGELARLPQISRAAILGFLASHVVHTPMMTVKVRLLASLNQVRGVASSTRTRFLLPVLQQWAALSSDEVQNRCMAESIHPSEMDTHAVMTVVASDKEGVEFLTSIIQGYSASGRQSLLHVVFQRLRALWSSLKSDLGLHTATFLLECTQLIPKTEHDDIVLEQSTELLQSMDLSSKILSSFLSSIPTIAQLADQPPATKKRRTSHGEVARLPLPDSQQLTAALRRVTYVLQLIHSSNPGKHPELLGGLFNALVELQHLKTQATSELAYLQGLLLNSLISIVEAQKSTSHSKIERSAVRADLLVDCVQKTSSPQVQNSALLLIAGLASTSPELVLHSVMPIFTFLGSSTLRQNDDYSAQVIDRTVREVIPPLIISLRKNNTNLIAGASELLLSFVAAYEHVPQHRRKGLFTSLIQTLGAEDFFFALLAMLVNKYGATNDIIAFALDISSSFGVEVQLVTTLKYLELVIDVLDPKPTISSTLLNAPEVNTSSPQEVATNELALLPHLLSQKRLVVQTAKHLNRDDMEAAKVRDIYSNTLEMLLQFAHSSRDHIPLHSACGDVLESLLGLLSVTEFVKSVETLLDRADKNLQRKLLRSVEARVDKEETSNAESRTAMLAFLPQLTAIIRESTDMLYKHIAVACVDKISEKYGKKDLEAVSAAAETIASKYCLGQADNRLRVMALLCLTSLVDILREGIVSVLPIAIPKCLDYLSSSVSREEEAQKIHNACFTFVSALVHHLPYMMTGGYLERLLSISSNFADVDLDDDSNEARSQCLHLAAKQVDANSMFSALEKNWNGTVTAGPMALREYIDILGTTIDKHPRSVITKYSAILGKIFQHGLDIRRSWAVTSVSVVSWDMITANEERFNVVALKMLYKFNDSTFRPMFSDLLDWATRTTPQNDYEKIWRLQSLYGFLEVFFGDLKSIVTSYAALLIDTSVDVLKATDLKEEKHQILWTRVLKVLGKCFEHDQDDFWQSPSHFNAVVPILCAQFAHSSSLPVVRDLIPAIVELAAAADSTDHHKEINAKILKHLRSERANVRLAALKCQQALTDRLGEEWLSMLPEMLPFISELQEDDDEIVEKETHRWIVKIEGVLGESLDAMLQ